MSDLTHNGNGFEQTLEQYMGLINTIAASYPEHHREDMCQEGIIGLYSAFCTFSEQFGVPFAAYAALCIRRRMISAYRRVKKSDADVPLDEVPEKWLRDDTTPDSVITRNALRDLIHAVETKLSTLEKEVLEEYLRSSSLSEVAAKLDISEKSADNAMTRVKAKLRAQLSRMGEAE